MGAVGRGGSQDVQNGAVGAGAPEGKVGILLSEWTIITFFLKVILNPNKGVIDTIKL